ncbi:MAG: hypothetical protein JOZ52_00590 [Acidobacteria bacterium]|nr:hypothetical protein [Acidobacteriota bacterium]
MKNIRLLVAATILTIAFSASASAGDMHTTGLTVTPPPAPPPSPVKLAESPDTTVPAYDTLTEAALLFCHHVFSLL